MGKRNIGSGVVGDKPNQRVGSVSNSMVGADFELVALKFFEKCGIKLLRNFAVDVGLSHKKKHCFDLGGGLPTLKSSSSVSHISGRLALTFRALK